MFNRDASQYHNGKKHINQNQKPTGLATKKKFFLKRMKCIEVCVKSLKRKEKKGNGRIENTGQTDLTPGVRKVLHEGV